MGFRVLGLRVFSGLSLGFRLQVLGVSGMSGYQQAEIGGLVPQFKV